MDKRVLELAEKLAAQGLRPSLTLTHEAVGYGWNMTFEIPGERTLTVDALREILKVLAGYETDLTDTSFVSGVLGVRVTAKAPPTDTS